MLGVSLNILIKTYSAWTNHDNGALGICGQAESRAADVNRRLVDGLLLICATGTLDSVCRGINTRRIRTAVGRDEGSSIAVGSVLQVQQKVGSNTVYPLSRNLLAGNAFVFEHDGGNVDSGGVELGAGRDGVVPGLQTGDGRNDDVERNGPLGRVLSVGNSLQVVAGSELENLSEFEAAVGHNGAVLFLVGAQRFEESLSIRRGGKLGEMTEDLATCDSADIDVVAEDGNIGGGDRERNLGESRVERLNSDNLVFLLPQAKCTEKTGDFDFWVRRPNTNVVAMLIGYSRTFDTKLNVDAVTVAACLEELP